MSRNDHLKGTTRQSLSAVSYIPCRIHALPSTIHMTMILPPVATNSITANISAHRSFCHQGRSNGLSWLTKIQSESASLKIFDLFKASSIKSRNSLRFSRNSSVILRSRICALQLYKCSRVVLFIFTRIDRRADHDPSCRFRSDRWRKRRVGSIDSRGLSVFCDVTRKGPGSGRYHYDDLQVARLFTEEACALLIWIYCIRIEHPA